MIARTVLVLGAVALVACTPAPNTPRPTDPSQPTTATTPTGDDPQRLTGERYFRRDCASCHGEQGEGTPSAPRVIGAGALPFDPPAYALQRKSHFLTARDVFRFIDGHMPNDAIGQTVDSYYWDLLAYMLAKNGIDYGQLLDASTAPSIVLHGDP